MSTEPNKPVIHEHNGKRYRECVPNRGISTNCAYWLSQSSEPRVIISSRALPIEDMTRYGWIALEEIPPEPEPAQAAPEDAKSESNARAEFAEWRRNLNAVMLRHGKRPDETWGGLLERKDEEITSLKNVISTYQEVEAASDDLTNKHVAEIVRLKQRLQDSATHEALNQAEGEITRLKAQVSRWRTDCLAHNGPLFSALKKDRDALKAELEALKRETRNRCPHCGATLIDNCPTCGAPQCCPQCCKIQSLTADLEAEQNLTATQAAELRERAAPASDLGRIAEALEKIAEHLKPAVLTWPYSPPGIASPHIWPMPYVGDFPPSGVPQWTSTTSTGPAPQPVLAVTPDLREACEKALVCKNPSEQGLCRGCRAQLRAALEAAPRAAVITPELEEVIGKLIASVDDVHGHRWEIENHAQHVKSALSRAKGQDVAPPPLADSQPNTQ